MGRNRARIMSCAMMKLTNKSFLLLTLLRTCPMNDMMRNDEVALCIFMKASWDIFSTHTPRAYWSSGHKLIAIFSIHILSSNETNSFSGNRLRVHFSPTHRQCRHPLPFKESQFGDNLAIRWRHYRWVEDRCTHKRIEPVTSAATEFFPLLYDTMLQKVAYCRCWCEIQITMVCNT